MLKWLIDQVLPGKETAMLLAAALAIFLSCLGRATLTSIGNYLTVNAVRKMALRLRMNLLLHLDRLSADYYDNTPAGVLMYPLKDPIEEVSYFGSDLLPSILHMCLSTVFTLTTVFLLSPGLSVAMLAIIPLFLIARQHFRRILSSEAMHPTADTPIIASWSTTLFMKMTRRRRAPANSKYSRDTAPKKLFWAPVSGGRWRVDWPRTNRST